MKIFASSWAICALLSSTFFSVSTLACPEKTQTNGLAKRQDPDRSGHIDNCIDYDVDLTDDDVGKLMCSDQRIPETAGPIECDKCLGLNGNDAQKTEKYIFCAIVTKRGDSDIDPYTNRTACPGDDVPETDPDGNPSSDIYEGIADAWCAVAGSGGYFGWLNMAACYSWVFASNQGTALEEAEAGVNLLCDTFFLGLCSCINADVCG